MRDSIAPILLQQYRAVMNMDDIRAASETDAGVEDLTTKTVAAYKDVLGTLEATVSKLDAANTVVENKMAALKEAFLGEQAELRRKIAEKDEQIEELREQLQEGAEKIKELEALIEGLEAEKRALQEQLKASEVKFKGEIAELQKKRLQLEANLLTALNALQEGSGRTSTANKELVAHLSKLAGIDVKLPPPSERPADVGGAGGAGPSDLGGEAVPGGVAVPAEEKAVDKLLKKSQGVLARRPDELKAAIDALAALSGMTAEQADKLSKARDIYRQIASPELSLPGVAYVNDRYQGASGPPPYFNIEPDRSTVQFTPMVPDLNAYSFRLPIGTVLFGNSGPAGSPIKDLSVASKEVKMKGFEALLGEPDTKSRKIGLMLGASGSGKSFATAANLKYLRREFDKLLAVDPGAQWDLELHFAYGTATLTEENQMVIETKEKSWKPLEKADGEYVTKTKPINPDGKFIKALENSKFEDDATGLGAVSLLELVCQTGLIPGFQAQLIAQTRNNPKSSRGSIAWKICMGNDTRGWDCYIIMDLAGNETAYDIINKFFLLDRLRDKIMAETGQTQAQVEDLLVATFLRHKNSLDGKGDAVTISDIKVLDGLFSEKVSIAVNNEEVRAMADARRDSMPEGLTGQAQLNIEFAFAPETTAAGGMYKMWKYVQQLASQSLYIKFMVAAFAALLTDGKSPPPGMKYTFPFLAGNPRQAVKRYCVQNEKFCSNQGAGMYYPFDFAGPAKEDLTIDEIDALHAKGKAMLLEGFRNGNAEINRVYPIMALLGRITKKGVVKDDAQAKVIFPSHGTVPYAVVNATWYLLRQLVGDFLPTALDQV
jgi:hypothetical protein